MLRQTNQQPITAIYPRLSHEDELQGESYSTSNQKRILETYAKQNGFYNLRWYTDDGYSGANFQRPGFQSMLADIEAGKVATGIAVPAKAAYPEGADAPALYPWRYAGKFSARAGTPDR